MNWKRVISGVLATAMLSALPVQLLVSAEGTEAVGQADGWQELTTLEPLDESNTFFYSKDDQTFEKITHPEKNVKTADGIVDYLGDGAVAVVTDPGMPPTTPVTGVRTTHGRRSATGIGCMWAPATPPSATPSP